MSNIKIRRVNAGDIDQLHNLFKVVINDTFKINDIEDLKDEIDEEIKTKKRYLELDINSKGKDRYFLIAEQDSKIIGCIEYGKVGKMIIDCTDGKIESNYEVGTIFVLPNYQGIGVGRKLIESIVDRLKSIGQVKFCLDSGYKTSQKIWTHKFGTPDCHIPDYWGEGYHHMIWEVEI